MKTKTQAPKEDRLVSRLHFLQEHIRLLERKLDEYEFLGKDTYSIVNLIDKKEEEMAFIESKLCF